MFGLGRRKTHSQLVKAELGESLDHFMRAATHAAGGVGTTVGPRMQTAREYVGPTATRVKDTATSGWQSTMTAFAPLAAAAADGARQAGSTARKARSKKMRVTRKKESLMARRRWSMLTGLLAAGAVLGAAGAMAVRRRRQQDWDSYDPDHSLDAVRSDAEAIAASTSEATPARDMARSSTMPTGKAADQAIEQVIEKTAPAGEQLAKTTGSITDGAKQTAAKSTEKADGMVGNARTPSRNSRG